MRGRCVGVRSVPSTRSSSVNATVGIRASITLLRTQSNHRPPSTLTALSFRASASPFILPPLHVPPLPNRPPPSANWASPPGGMPAASRAVLWSRYEAAAQLAQTHSAGGRSRPSNIYPVSFRTALLRPGHSSAPLVIVVRKGPFVCPGAAQYATPRALEVGGTWLPNLACVHCSACRWLDKHQTPPPAARGTLATVLSVSPPTLALNAVTSDLAFPLPSDTSLPSHPVHLYLRQAAAPFRTPVPATHREGYLLPKRIASGRPVSIRSRP